MTPTQREAALRLADWLHASGLVNSEVKETIALLRDLRAEPQGEPVAWNQTAYAALQQAMLALEDLDGPGYLIGGVMHHRIGLILPMLNAAMKSLIDHPPQQRKPLTRNEIDAIWNGMGSFTDRESDYRAFARAIERAHGIVEAP